MMRRLTFVWLLMNEKSGYQKVLQRITSSVWVTGGGCNNTGRKRIPPLEHVRDSADHIYLCDSVPRFMILPCRGSGKAGETEPSVIWNHMHILQHARLVQLQQIINLRRSQTVLGIPLELERSFWKNGYHIITFFRSLSFVLRCWNVFPQLVYMILQVSVALLILLV